MERKQAALGEIYDVHAIRVLVEDVKDCYAALGVVHSLWRPIPGQFDDYIAMPKGNLYQSLHTAVVGLDGKPVEIQIRTHAMHRVAEMGIAAHWRYKEGGRQDRAYDAKLASVRQLLDWQRDVSDAREFVEGIKLDVFQDQVFVFTPKGEVKDLPAGATPIDFAYRIHTDVGHRRESLDRKLRRLAWTSIQALGGERIAEVARNYNHENVDDFYAAIGYGAIGTQQVVMRLGVVDDQEIALPTVAPPQPARTGGVRVKGVGDLLVRFGRCCHPIPGDPIVGFVTRGKGVTVHIRTCSTVVNERDVERLIEVEWEGQAQQTYPIASRGEAFDRTGLLNDIANVVAENKINIVAAHGEG